MLKRMFAVFGLVALSSVAIGAPVPASLPYAGLERPTTRAETFANSIAIHDDILRQLCGSPDMTSASTAAGCQTATALPETALHPYWTAIIRLVICLGAPLVVGLALSRHRTGTAFIIIAVAVSSGALLDTINVAVGTANRERVTAARMIRAEAQWRIDLATASSLDDRAGASAVLTAVRRFAAAAQPASVPKTFGSRRR